MNTRWTPAQYNQARRATPLDWRYVLVMIVIPLVPLVLR